MILNLKTCYKIHSKWNNKTQIVIKHPNVAAFGREIFSWHVCEHVFGGNVFMRESTTHAHTNNHMETRKHTKLNCWFSISMACNAEQMNSAPQNDTDKKIERIHYLALIRWYEKMLSLGSTKVVAWFIETRINTLNARQCENIQMDIVKSVNKVTKFKYAWRCRARRKLLYPSIQTIWIQSVEMWHFRTLSFQKSGRFSMFLFTNFTITFYANLFYFACLPITCSLALSSLAMLRKSSSHQWITNVLLNKLLIFRSTNMTTIFSNSPIWILNTWTRRAKRTIKYSSFVSCFFFFFLPVVALPLNVKNAYKTINVN